MIALVGLAGLVGQPLVYESFRTISERAVQDDYQVATTAPLLISGSDPSGAQVSTLVGGTATLRNSPLTIGLEVPLQIKYGGTGGTGPWTPGSVIFVGTTAAFSQDNASFFYDVTNHRLGLNTNAPNELLDVRGKMRLGDQSHNNYPADSPSFYFSTALTNVIGNWTAVTAGGNGAQFTLRADGSGAGNKMVSGNWLGTIGFRGMDDLGFASTSSALIAATATETWSSTAHGTRIEIGVTANGSTTRAVAVTIDQSGFVGIGTTGPAGKLHTKDTGVGINVYSIIDAEATGQAALAFYKSGSSKWIEYVPASSNDLRWFDSADRVTFQAGGNVGIGTTAPVALLHVGNIVGAGADSTNRGYVLIESGQTDAATNGLEFKASTAGSGFGYRFATIYDGASNIDFRLQSRQGSASWTPVIYASGATSRVSTKLADMGGAVFNVMAAPYGAKGDGTTDDTAAINSAITAAQSPTPAGTVLLPSGYKFKTTGNHQITKPGLRIVGGGSATTTILLEHATNDLFVIPAGTVGSFTAGGTRDDISIGGFSVDSATTRTGGWIVKWSTGTTSGEYIRRSRFFDMNFEHQYSGIWLSSYEYCWLDNILYDHAPAGSGGIGFKIGDANSTNNCAEVYFNGCQVNNRSSSANALSYGFWVEDADAGYFVNCGAIASLNSLRIQSTGRGCSNHFFSNFVADGTSNTTANNHSAWITNSGANANKRIRFANCWFSAAGRGTGGGGGAAACDACHVDDNSLVYSNFSNCYFGTAGRDGLNATGMAGTTVTGCTFGGAAGNAGWGARLVDCIAVFSGNEFDSNTLGGLFVNGTAGNINGHFVGNYFLNATSSWTTSATSARVGFIGNYYLVAPTYGVAPGLNVNNVTY